MANFKTINKGIKEAFPNKDIEAVRGQGYIYFDGVDGFDKVDSIYVNPCSISTEDALKFCLENIEYSLVG